MNNPIHLQPVLEAAPRVDRFPVRLSLIPNLLTRGETCRVLALRLVPHLALYRYKYLPTEVGFPTLPEDQYLRLARTESSRECSRPRFQFSSISSVISLYAGNPERGLRITVSYTGGPSPYLTLYLVPTARGAIAIALARIHNDGKFQRMPVNLGVHNHLHPELRKLFRLTRENFLPLTTRTS